MNTDKKKIPVKEGLFTFPIPPDGKPQLIGCKCPSCQEILFPNRDICQNCQESGLEEINLSTKGKIYSFTIVMQGTAAYRGEVPYAFGWVELPEGVRVETHFTGCEFEKLRIGMEVEMVVEKLYDENETEIVCHKFRPVE